MLRAKANIRAGFEFLIVTRIDEMYLAFYADVLVLVKLELLVGWDDGDRIQPRAEV